MAHDFKSNDYLADVIFQIIIFMPHANTSSRTSPPNIDADIQQCNYQIRQPSISD
jgi:hypothetical protein